MTLHELPNLEPGPSQAEVCLWLESRLRQVISKRGGFAVCLWGGPGIGKSFRVESLLRSLPYVALKVTAGNAMLALIQALPPAVATLPVWAERRLEDARAGKLLDAVQVAEAVSAQLETLKPVVVVVEDLHRASADVVSFLEALRQNTVRSRGVALLTTSRLPQSGFESLQLSVLAPKEIRGMLESGAGATMPEAAHDWIWQRSQGNPLFALEYFAFLSRQGFLWNDARRWRWREPKDTALPTNLEGLLARTLEAAIDGPESRVLLEALAVLPEGLSEKVIQTTAGLYPGVFKSAMEHLEGLAILRHGRFAHPLYRDAMLTRVSPLQRRELARRGLKAIDAKNYSMTNSSVESGAVLASELLEAAHLEPEEMLSRLLAATNEARLNGDLIAAARLQARAVDHAHGDAQGSLAFEAARHMLQINLTEATRLSGIAHLEHPEDAETAWLHAECLVRSGETAQAERLLGTVYIFKTEVWWGRLLRFRVQQHDFAAAAQLWASQPQWQDEAEPLVRRDAAWALALLGELDRAEMILGQHLDPAPQVTDAALLRVALGYLRTLQGRAMEANALIGPEIEILEQSSVPRDLARALELQAEVLEQIGDFPAAAGAAERAVRVRGELGDALGVSRAQSRLASVLLELGEYERAEDLLLEGYAVLERLNVDTAMALWEAQLANLYSEWLSPYRASLALRHAHSALERARKSGSPVLLGDALTCAGLIEAQHGDAKIALTLSLESLRLAEETGHANEAALENLAHAAALEALGHRDQALPAYERAVNQLLQAGLASSERYALELDRLRNDEPAARERLERFKSIGHVHAANLARRYFPNLERVAQSGTVELQVLGPLRVIRDLKPVRLNTRTGRTMLGWLLGARLAGRGGCSSLELCDALWPDVDERAAQTNLKHLVYRLRSSLGSGSILRLPDGYALGAVESDAEQFLKEGELGLWRGICFEDLDDDSLPVESRQSLMHQLLSKVQTRLELDARGAVKPARLLVLNEPYDLNAVRLLCLALHQSQNRRDLARSYNEAQKRMLEVGEILPERWQEFLEA
jgi:DNA-binding SARP family transcriptional activator